MDASTRLWNSPHVGFMTNDSWAEDRSCYFLAQELESRKGLLYEFVSKPTVLTTQKVSFPSGKCFVSSFGNEKEMIETA